MRWTNLWLVWLGTSLTLESKNQDFSRTRDNIPKTTIRNQRLRSKIRCFNCDELGHFATDFKKPKKAYIAKGKSWDDTDDKYEYEEFGNYALMALEKGESSSSKSEYHEKNKLCANIAIGLDYDALNNNKKSEGDKGKAIINQDVPVMLRKVDAPLFKACEVNFSEVELVIKQEPADEDNEKKCTKTTPTSNTEKKPMVDQVSKKPIKEIKNKNAGRKKKNRNGKIGVNKSNNLHLLQMFP
ncbi:hypothetical protein AgCh_005095 [Apium graveolens]